MNRGVDLRYVATWLIVLPIFIHRAVIGGESGSYDDYTGVTFRYFGYICHFALLLLGARAIVLSPRVHAGALLFFGALLVLSVVHVGFASSATGVPWTELALPVGRGWLWVVAIYFYVQFYFDKEEFARVFFMACRIAAIISVVCIVFYVATGIPFGVHIARGYPRVQGLFSEPSTVAIAMPAYLIYAMRERRMVDVVLAALAGALSASVIVYLTILVAGGVYLAYQFGLRRAPGALVYTYVGFVIILPLLLTPEVAQYVSPWAESARIALGENEESGFVTIFVGRLLLALSTLSDVVVNYSIEDLGGGLARVMGPLVAMEELRTSGLQFVGFGLNAYGYIAVRNYGDVLDFGYFAFLVTSFGVVVAPLLVLAATRMSLKLAREPSGLGVILICGLLATLINSAGGLHSYALPTLALLLAFRPRTVAVEVATDPHTLRIGAAT